MDTFDIGDLFPLIATFRDLNGVATDPATVTLSIRTPDGTKTDYVYGTDLEVIKDVTGVYYISYVAAQAGYHGWSAHGTGAVQEGGSSGFYVRRGI
jgi:hypothetical protein